MRLAPNYYLLFSAILLILFIVPLIYVSQYVVLFADDLCRAVDSKGDYFLELRNWYNHHTGRYINGIISLLPVYNLNIYRIVISSQFVILGCFLIYFLHAVLEMYRISFGLSKKIFLSLLLFIFLISILPSLYEFFYWYAAVTAYLFSFIFFLLFTIFNWRIFLGYKWRFLPVALTVVFLNGNNEIFLGITNFMLLALLVWKYVKVRQWNYSLIALNAISWISSILVIISPATSSRRDHFSHGGDMYSAAKVAIIYGGRFVLEHFLELPFIIFYALVFVVAYRGKASYPGRKFVNPSFLLFISYFSVISMYFIMFYATGLVNRNFGRVGNILHLVLAIFFFLNIVNLAVFIKERKEIKILNSRYVFPVLAITLVSLFLFKDNNFKDSRRDIISGNLEKFREDIQKREQNLKQYGEKSVEVEPVEGTLLLKSGDLMVRDWVNDCYREYINTKLGKNFLHVSVRGE